MTLERFISIVEESDHKVGIYPELKSALAANLVKVKTPKSNNFNLLLEKI